MHRQGSQRIRILSRNGKYPEVSAHRHEERGEASGEMTGAHHKGLYALSYPFVTSR